MKLGFLDACWIATYSRHRYDIWPGAIDGGEFIHPGRHARREADGSVAESHVCRMKMADGRRHAFRGDDASRVVFLGGDLAGDVGGVRLWQAHHPEGRDRIARPGRFPRP